MIAAVAPDGRIGEDRSPGRSAYRKDTPGGARPSLDGAESADLASTNRPASASRTAAGGRGRATLATAPPTPMPWLHTRWTGGWTGGVAVGRPWGRSAGRSTRTAGDMANEGPLDDLWGCRQVPKPAPPSHSPVGRVTGAAGTPAARRGYARTRGPHRASGLGQPSPVAATNRANQWRHMASWSSAWARDRNPTWRNVRCVREPCAMRSKATVVG